MSRVTSPELIGRVLERTALVGALDAARVRRPSLVVIAGEAGVGKTRLVTELVLTARAGGQAVMVGSGMDLGGDQLAFGPLTQALRSFAATEPTTRARELFMPFARDLAPILPELAAGDGVSAPTVGYAPRPIDGFVDAVRRLAEAHGALLVIEDVHWADGSTRHALTVLARSLGDAPLLVLLTLRTDNLDRRRRVVSWLGELMRVNGTSRIDLQPLSHEDIHALIRSIADPEPSSAVIDEICERSDGNPFFVEELLALRAARGPEASVPHVVRDAVLDRVGGLDAGSQRVLRVASVIGRRMDHALLLAATGAPDAALESAVRAAVDAHLLVPDDDGTYTFRHALAREAIYRDLLDAERRRYHARCAIVLSKADARAGTDEAGRLGLIAHHWDHAGNAARALHAALAAAREAQRHGGYSEAAVHFERALELWTLVPPAERPVTVTEEDLCLAAAEASDAAGSFLQASLLVDRAIARSAATGDRASLGRALHAAGQIRWHLMDQRSSVEAYERAVDVLAADEADDLPMAQASLALQLVRDGRMERALRLADEAITGASRLGLRAVEGRAKRAKGVALSYRGEHDLGIGLIREALDIAREDPADPIDIGEAQWELGTSIGRACRVDEAVAHWRAASDEARCNGSWRRFGILYDLGLVVELTLQGRLQEAASELDRLEPEASTGLPRLVHRTQSSRIAAIQGSRLLGPDERAEVVRDIEAADAQFASYVTAVLIENDLAAQDLPAALQAVVLGLRVAGDAEPMFATCDLLLVSCRAVAEVLADARARHETTTIESLRRPVEDLDRRVSAAERHSVVRLPRAAAFLAGSRAELSRARAPSDPRLWMEAEMAFRAAHLGYEAADAAYRLAESLAESTGVRQTAAEPLLRAFEDAMRLGAQPLVARCEELARRTRVDLHPNLDLATSPSSTEPDPLSPYGLSPRERQVLGLVAAGRTNREIAGALFITPGTAGVHVSNVIAKLGVANRVQAAALASRLEAPRHR